MPRFRGKPIPQPIPPSQAAGLPRPPRRLGPKIGTGRLGGGQAPPLACRGGWAERHPHGSACTICILPVAENTSGARAAFGVEPERVHRRSHTATVRSGTAVVRRDGTAALLHAPRQLRNPIRRLTTILTAGAGDTRKEPRAPRRSGAKVTRDRSPRATPTPPDRRSLAPNAPRV